MANQGNEFHRAFNGSLWGACCGVALGAVIAQLVLRLQAPLPGLPSEFLPENTVYGSELPEKIFFLLSFFLGSVGAFIAAMKPVSVVRSSIAVASWFCGFVYALSQWMLHVYSGGAWLIWCAGTVLWLSLPLLLSGKLSGLRAVLQRKRSAATAAGTQTVLCRPQRTCVRKRLFDMGCLTVLALMILPSSIAIVAARVGFDAHPVAFITGPALYFWGDSLIPGRDFYTQYGVGQGFVFSFFIGGDAQTTVENFVRLMAVLTWAFYGLSYLVLRSLMGSGLWAFLTTVFMAILNFHLERTFIDPSSWPIRYPLLFTTVWLIVQAVGSTAAVKNYLALGICCGLSIFWNTETGIYSLATACFVSIALNDITSRKTWLYLGYIITAAAITFLGLSGLVYGTDTLSTTYLLGLIEPLLIFSSGYAAVPVNWAPGWGYLYNLIGPIISIATIGWVLARMRHDLPVEERQKLCGIFSLAVFGLLFLLKWVNMSLDAVWHMNAYPVIIVASWWLRVWFLSITANHAASVRVVTALCIVGLAASFLLFVDDPRNRTAYAGKAFWIYPSLLKRIIVKPQRYEWPAAQAAISPEDVALITSLTAPREQVAIIHPVDWAYLIQARRPPRFHFLPSTSTFLSRHLESSLAGASYIFVKRSLLQGQMLKSHADYILPLLRDQYELYREGADLVVLKRKS